MTATSTQKDCWSCHYRRKTVLRTFDASPIIYQQSIAENSWKRLETQWVPRAYLLLSSTDTNELHPLVQKYNLHFSSSFSSCWCFPYIVTRNVMLMPILNVLHLTMTVREMLFEILITKHCQWFVWNVHAVFKFIENITSLLRFIL